MAIYVTHLRLEKFLFLRESTLKYLLIAGAAILIASVASALVSWAQKETTEDLYEEARRNRIRILNQQGQLPGGYDY